MPRYADATVSASSGHPTLSTFTGLVAEPAPANESTGRTGSRVTTIDTDSTPAGHATHGSHRPRTASSPTAPAAHSAGNTPAR
jgi:hypothetical protein